MTGPEAVSASFNTAQAEDAQAFVKSLSRIFSADTARAVVEKMELMRIPVPQSAAQYMESRDGVFIFSNRHGVILRIEKEDGKGYEGSMRAHDSEGMLQPLATLQAGKAVIELHAGVHPETRDAASRKLYWRLWADGYDYWDERIDNAGRLPYQSPKFPEGVTVAIDRLSVHRLTDANRAVCRALELLKGSGNRYNYRSEVRVEPSPAEDIHEEWRAAMKEILARPPSLEGANRYELEGYAQFLEQYPKAWPEGAKEPDYGAATSLSIPLRRAMDIITRDRLQNGKVADPGREDPQEILYGGMRRAFLDAWPDGAPAPDAAKMAAFWRLVLDTKAEGKLVAGWNEDKTAEGGYRAGVVQKAAAAYDALAARIGEARPAPSAPGAAYPKLES